jgi:hypothetical protein
LIYPGKILLYYLEIQKLQRAGFFRDEEVEFEDIVPLSSTRDGV